MAVLTRALGISALILIAALAGLIGWARATALANPQAVLQVIPSQSDALLASAERLRKADKTKELPALGERILRSAPLSEAPLVYRGLALAQAGDSDSARKSLRAAQHRQPRNIPAVSWLAVDAIQRKDYATAAKLLETLQELDHTKSDLYANAWAMTIEAGQGEAVLEARLAAKSILARRTLQLLNAKALNFDLLVRLTEHVPDEQSRLVSRLVETRGPAIAFLAWLDFAPHSETIDFSWPFDPAFVGSKAPQPFNWIIGSGAELLKDGGLYARYFGKGAPVFAQQLILLGSGNYAFTAEMDGSMDETGGSFDWAIRCRSASQDLAVLPVSGLRTTPANGTLNFTVPAEGCDAQVLVLRGHPGEFPARAQVNVRRVSIQPVQAAPG